MGHLASYFISRCSRFLYCKMEIRSRLIGLLRELDGIMKVKYLTQDFAQSTQQIILFIYHKGSITIIAYH